jgi:hypothetical protein
MIIITTESVATDTSLVCSDHHTLILSGAPSLVDRSLEFRLILPSLRPFIETRDRIGFVNRHCRLLPRLVGNHNLGSPAGMISATVRSC